MYPGTCYRTRYSSSVFFTVNQSNDSLREHIAKNLARLPIRAAEQPNNYRYAAVALTVADEAHGADLPGLPRFDTWQSRAALILTRRSSKLRNHPGQWAIPGGRLEPGESPEDTALREMREEVNLDLSSDAVIGRLDDFVTRSGFVISPVVVWGGPGLQLERNPDEVESIHRIPVDEFLRQDAPLLEESDASDHPVLRMPVGNTWIAAPTAAILYQFAQVCLAGNQIRVAHYDQPKFAWR